MKEYKIVIIAHFVDEKLEASLTVEPKVFYINAASFMDAVGEANRLAGIEDERWHEHRHEVVSVRLRK